MQMVVGSTLGLWLAGGVFLTGLALWWRQRRRRQIISSTMLWQIPSGAGRTGGFRRGEWLGLLIWLAATAALLAWADVGWQTTHVILPKPAELRTNTNGNVAVLWAELTPEQAALPGLRALVHTPTQIKPLAVWQPGQPRQMTLRCDSTQPMTFNWWQDATRMTEWHYRAGHWTFTTRYQGANATAWRRVLEVQPEFTASASADTPVVLAWDKLVWTANAAAGAHVVLLHGRAVGPGITPAGVPTTMPTAAVPQLATDATIPARFDLVRVQRMVPAQLDTNWRILATVAGQPWLAQRTDQGAHWLWCASDLQTTESNWPLDPSYVITVRWMLEQALKPASDGDLWSAQPVPEAAVSGLRTGPGWGLLVLGLVLVLQLYLWWQWRH
ncbi:MAG: hypothetical protein WCJ97_08275 [Phycisphaerae bacterium]